MPPLRKLLIWLDDALEYGNRNSVWKWWLDLEIRDGKVMRPAKTNQRDLRLKRPPPHPQKIPLHSAEFNPPPASRDAHPVDRRAAQARSTED
jgi:hypothetical protein